MQPSLILFKIQISIKKIAMMKQKSLSDQNSIMKVVGTSMTLESWNFNLLGQPLALNFVTFMADSSAMELRQKEYIESVMVIKVIWNPPLSLPPSKPPDLNLHAGAVSGSFLVKLQGVQLSSSNQRKLEKVSTCNSNFQIPTLWTRLTFRRGVLLGYKEKGELVNIVRLLMS